MHAGELIMHIVLVYAMVLQHHADAISLHVTRVYGHVNSLHTHD